MTVGRHDVLEPTQPDHDVFPGTETGTEGYANAVDLARDALVAEIRSGSAPYSRADPDRLAERFAERTVLPKTGQPLAETIAEVREDVLSDTVDDGAGRAEVGYWIAGEHEGNGYATEALWSPSPTPSTTAVSTR